MKKVLVILLGVLMVAGGIFCLLQPVATFLTTGYVIGVFILCDAIANIVAWFDAKQYVNISGWYLFGAIVSLIFGIVIIVNVKMQFAVDMAVIYLICVWLVVAAIFRISLGVRIKKVMDLLPKAYRNSRWLWLVILGVLMIVFAGICMAQPGVMSVVLGVLISWGIIFNGIGLITLGTYIPTTSQQN